MNVSSYLPDDLVRAVDRLATEQRSSRSAIIREALTAHVARLRPGAWPDDVLHGTGDADWPPFESLRPDDASADRGGPFDASIAQ